MQGFWCATRERKSETIQSSQIIAERPNTRQTSHWRACQESHIPESRAGTMAISSVTGTAGTTDAISDPSTANVSDVILGSVTRPSGARSIFGLEGVNMNSQASDECCVARY